MRKIRVLEMVDRPFLGGGQITVLNLARNLDRDKFDVLVCSAGDGPLVEELRKAGVRHLPAPLSKSLRPAGRRAVCDILRGQSIDILHTHGGVAGFQGRMAGRRAGTPVVVHTIHGIHYLHYRNPLLRRAFLILERRMSRFSDAVVVVSQADLDKALALKLAPPDKLKLIRNGVEPATSPGAEELSRLRAELGLGAGPVVGAVSRLHRQKGILYLLRSAPLVCARFPTVKFLVAGGGPLRDSLMREVRKKGLEKTFFLLGERQDARRIMALFDVFALPSLWEGLPYVLVEAADLGKPIVASAIDGVREVMEDGRNGILVQPRDPRGMAEAIIRLLDDHNLASRLGRRAKEDIPPGFSISGMIKETEGFYLDLFRRSPKGSGLNI